MDRFPNLKLITTRSTGFDHIDSEEAKKRGITVSNVIFETFLPFTSTGLSKPKRAEQSLLAPATTSTEQSG